MWFPENKRFEAIGSFASRMIEHWFVPFLLPWRSSNWWLCIKPGITRPTAVDPYTHRNCYYCIRLIIQSVYYFTFFVARKNVLFIMAFCWRFSCERSCILYPSICYLPHFFGNFCHCNENRREKKIEAGNLLLSQINFALKMYGSNSMRKKLCEYVRGIELNVLCTSYHVLCPGV